MQSTIRSYRDLIVWQRATQLAIAVYEVTEFFPDSEKFGLISQMRRASVSIASNIAEGRYRGTRKDFGHFLRMAYASGAELETQIFIAKHLKKMQTLDFRKVDMLLTETMKMLNGMMKAF